MIPRCKDEGEFNASLRGAMRAQGLGALHIREADSPGPSDLIVWSAAEILGWVELKIDNKPLEVSQREFLREQGAKGGNCFVFDLDRKGSRIVMLRGADPHWVELEIIDRTDNLHIPWKNWFWRHKRDVSRYR